MKNVVVFGLDELNNQSYECHIEEYEDPQVVAREILKGMDHIHSVVIVQSVPNVSQYKDCFRINYRINFLGLMTKKLEEEHNYYEE